MSKEHTFQQPLETPIYAFPGFEVETSEKHCCLLNLSILVLLQTCKDQFSDMQKKRMHLFSTLSSKLYVIYNSILKMLPYCTYLLCHKKLSAWRFNNTIK